jgi:hypothetical protein
MKKSLTIIALLFCIAAHSQSVDSVNNAIQIKPVINYFTHDTAYQLTWKIISIDRDSVSAGNSYVQLFDRKGNAVYSVNVSIPRETINAWVNDIVIDNYILFRLKLQKRD